MATLLLLFACKGLAYALSLSSFRGGPVFPALFVGAAAGVAASHLPGLSLVPAIAMGIGAMSCVMLSLPLTSVLLVSLLLGADGVAGHAARDRGGRRRLHRGGAAGARAPARAGRGRRARAAQPCAEHVIGPALVEQDDRREDRGRRR